MREMDSCLTERGGSMNALNPIDLGNPAAAKRLRFQTPPDPPLRLTGLFAALIVLHCAVLRLSNTG